MSIKGEGGGITKTITVAITIESSVEPDFEISVVPPSQTITPPQSTSYVINIIGKGDFVSNVGLAISGLPAGAQASFEPPSGVLDYTSTLSLTVGQTISPGTYALTIYASGGGKTKSTVVNLVVQEISAPPTTSTPTTPTPTTPVIGPSSILGMLTENAYLIVIIILVLVIAALVMTFILRGRRKGP